MSSHDGAGGEPGRDPGNAGLTGTIIGGRYRILRKLGEGAMGGVYLGEHLKVGRRDAIKVLRGGLEHDAESIARFLRGARNLSAIRHPNVCTLYDYGETDDGAPFLALEFVTGETLLDVIARERRLEPARAFRIVRQTADALQAAHDAGIVHRDLKPANIMIERGRDGADFVKVVDFDIAKNPRGQAGDELTSAGVVVGTMEYMSPEQILGQPLDGRSDLYSLGIVLFRLLAGVFPFRNTVARAIMTERLTAAPLTLAVACPKSVFPASVQTVLDRSLAPDRNLRFSSASEFAAAIAAIERSNRNPVKPAVADAQTRPWTTQPPPTRASSHGRRNVRIRDRIAAFSSSRITAFGIAAGIVAVGAIVVLFAGPRTGASRDASGTATAGETTSRLVQQDPSSATIVIDPETATDVLFGLLQRLQAENPAMDALTAVESVRDTAEAIYRAVGVSDQDRGLAAYIVAIYYNVGRDASQCRDWLNRALSMDPQRPGFRELSTSCAAASR